MAILTPDVLGQVSSLTNYNGNLVTIEASLLDIGPFVVTGLVPSIGTGLSVNVTAGTASIGGRVTKSTTWTIGSLAPSTTVHLYLLNSGSGTSNTTGTAPANSCKLGTCITGVGTVSSVDTTPASGRQIKPTGYSDDAVILAPAASARNVILPTGDYTPLTLTGVAGQTSDLFEVVENGGNVAFKLGASGKPTVTKKLALTTSTTDVMEFGHQSSGTPAGGFGSRELWRLQSDTTTGREAFDQTTTWATATDASRKARTVMNAWDTGARECLRMEASGSAPLIGFLGAAAVVRQTLGAAATDPATTQTLANNLRTALINLGLGQT